MPLQKGWENPETNDDIEKYLGGAVEQPTEGRIKVLQAIHRHCSAFGGILSIHIEGSLAAQRMTLYLQADWEKFKAAARRSIKVLTDHTDYKDLPIQPSWKMTG